MLRALIVEDEPASRQRLKRLLNRHAETVEIIAEAESGPEAIRKIQECQPDLVFLDVSLPGLDGFDVLEEVTSNLKVIITSAHQEHAVRAFRARAVHYLLKPIDPAQLADALSRIQSVAPPPMHPDGSRDTLSRILCRDRNTTHVIKLDDVLYFKADVGYTLVRTDAAEYLSDESLASLEQRIHHDFVRIHRSALVNVAHVSSLKHTEGEIVVVLRNGLELPVSRRHSQGLRDRLR